MEPERKKDCSLIKTAGKLMSLYQETSKLQKLHDDQLEEDLKIRQVQLSETQTELDEIKKQFLNAMKELSYAKLVIKEQCEHIKEMEDFILTMKPGKSDSTSESSESDDAIDFPTEVQMIRGRDQISSGSRDLSPIAEENPEEIPDYYDAINAYKSSLRISIGSDTDLSREKKTIIKILDDTKVVKVSFKKKLKKRYSRLFEMAHY